VNEHTALFGQISAKNFKFKLKQVCTIAIKKFWTLMSSCCHTF
jgi:hypothetical protein